MSIPGFVASFERNFHCPKSRQYTPRPTHYVISTQEPEWFPVIVK